MIDNGLDFCGDGDWIKRKNAGSFFDGNSSGMSDLLPDFHSMSKILRTYHSLAFSKTLVLLFNFSGRDFFFSDGGFGESFILWGDPFIQRDSGNKEDRIFTIRRRRSWDSFEDRFHLAAGGLE